MSETSDEITATTAADLLRGCHQRRLDRDGIPMILALVDERGTTCSTTNDRTRRDGAQLADLLGAYADALTPEPAFRPGDEGPLITVMQVLAYAHFKPSAAGRVPPTGGDR